MERGSTEEETKKLLRKHGYSNRAIREIEKLFSGAIIEEKFPVPMFSTPVEVIAKYYGEVPEKIRKLLNVERGSREVQTEA